MYQTVKCPYCCTQYSIFSEGEYVCPKCLKDENVVIFLEDNPLWTQEDINRAYSYISHKKQGKFFTLLESEDECREAEKQSHDTEYISKEKVDAWYPRTFAQKIDYILQYFADHMKYDGEFVSYSVEELKNILFIKESKFNSENLDDIIRQVRYILEYFIKIEYIDTGLNDKNKSVCFLRPMATLKDIQFICLTPKGLARVDELQKDMSNNKDVFVAMAFNDNTVPTREAIREGIKEAHFSEKFLDEIIHNQQIVPYMMRLIRECRFLIMDITDPNYGAYYEAGYALGLGKEVIITCSKEIFSKKDFANKLEEKALKPHFDIAQKQILVWEDTADLTKQLKEWILELSTRKR